MEVLCTVSIEKHGWPCEIAERLRTLCELYRTRGEKEELDEHAPSLEEEFKAIKCVVRALLGGGKVDVAIGYLDEQIATM